MLCRIHGVHISSAGGSRFSLRGLHIILLVDARVRKNMVFH